MGLSQLPMLKIKTGKMFNLSNSEILGVTLNGMVIGETTPIVGLMNLRGNSTSLPTLMMVFSG
jgi:hypothetical protein